MIFWGRSWTASLWTVWTMTSGFPGLMCSLYVALPELWSYFSLCVCALSNYRFSRVRCVIHCPKLTFNKHRTQKGHFFFKRAPESQNLGFTPWVLPPDSLFHLALFLMPRSLGPCVLACVIGTTVPWVQLHTVYWLQSRIEPWGCSCWVILLWHKPGEYSEEC